MLLLIGLITELVSAYLIQIKGTGNAEVSNVYALLEWLLVCWQFRRWGFLRGRPLVIYSLLLLPCLVWIAENVILGQINNFPPYFRILYDALIVLFSVSKINFMITHDDRRLLGRPDFLICIGFIIYFVYEIVYEWAFQYSSAQPRSAGDIYITKRIISLFGYINALTNIIFAIAFLRIPATKRFTLW